MTILPSSEWQKILLIIAVIWLLIELWRGWRLGLIRGLLKFIALILAWFAGLAATSMIHALLLFLFHISSPLIPGSAGLILGLIVYFLVNGVSSLLFKKTNHYRGFMQVVLGMGGACWGLLFGLFFLWGSISAVRSLGLLGEIRLLNSEKKGLPPSADPVACNLVSIKRALEGGHWGVWLMQVDPLSSLFYENTKNTIMMLSDHEALTRFLNDPNTQHFLSHPLMQKMLHDPQVQLAISSGNFMLLLGNKNIHRAFNDPTLWQQIKSFNLSTTLNAATNQVIKQ